MKRVAAIDCGTNSIRLLVADADPATGELKDLDRRMQIVRLGQGVDRTGRLAPEALERTFAACREYAAVIKGLGAEQVRFVATSASRDAENREDFVRGVVDILGVEPEVITGDQEAEFSYTGATKELTGIESAGAERLPGEGGGGRRVGLAQPFLVVDIGGGSTEFVLGDGSVRAARSVDVGCVRMTERHLVHEGEISDPPTAGQISAIKADVAAALDRAEETVPLREAATLVGLAGSVTTVAAIALGLESYDSEAIHHSRLSLAQVREITGRLLSSTHAERAAIPVMHPGRVDVIAAGALVLLSIMERMGAEEVVVSEHDILDGIAWSIAG
ncbi:exopolyphosphatase / guanosine-5'-triphosphate,3'-diphosphate pyrophosphatase [Streptomyces sp. 2323.1]|uniref:Ppx/GppA phosphatase family protein n=1 Tax=Streptomyces sp. 2323.1 TaxID=1938841 RepID=UPI000BB8AF50|nr:Ppx/GppA phosphatase family protein [Streptomyces sp. 2323.1]SOE13237.1 exopolyphosphatase / guanosine-5'-triphosphate,3'-diphosphate pyrophosphatase [Streptomyces sp. 2323.1]